MAEKNNSTGGLKMPSRAKSKKRYVPGICEEYIKEREAVFAKQNRDNQGTDSK